MIDCKSLTTAQLADVVPEDSARYHVFRFKHSHESDYLESNGGSVGADGRLELIFVLQYLSTPCLVTPSLSRRG